MSSIDAFILIWLLVLSLWVYSISVSTRHALNAITVVLKILAAKHGYKDQTTPNKEGTTDQ